jgi:hypothetical protein
MKAAEVDVIGGRQLTPDNLQFMGNCRLARTHRRLNQLLMMVEREIEKRKEELK